MKKMMITLGAVAASAAMLTAQAEEKPNQNDAAKPAEAVETESEESPLLEFALQLDVNSPTCRTSASFPIRRRRGTTFGHS